MIEVKKLQTEHLTNPIGISNTSPRLSWQIRSDMQNILQTAYEIQAASDETFHTLLWDSGKTESGNSIAVAYSGPKPKTGERIYWRVKIWAGEVQSDFSQPAFFELGLLSTSDWVGKWIEAERDIDPDEDHQEPLIRKSFFLDKKVKQARIYATAHGLYECTVNGRSITDHLFLPGRTVYCDRLQYQAFDITELLQSGENVLGIMLGDGWWRGSSSATNAHNRFGYKVGFLCQLAVTYTDDDTELIGSDSTFRYTAGPILRSDTKAGETYDARLLPEGWELPGFDDSGWEPCITAEYPLDNLVSTNSVPVRKKEEFHPSVFQAPNGETILDFGQNICGYVAFYAEACAGTRITMQHTEVLDKNGNFTVKHYIGDYSALGGRDDLFQQVEYIACGRNREYYHPHFSFFGFRYARIEGYPGEIRPEDFTAYAVYSDMEPTGFFECSNPSVNQLLKNTIWSQKGNFLEIPMDCPTRERAGWTGDAQLYSKTASILMDTYPFFEKWMLDVSCDQTASGKVVNITPSGEAYFMEEYKREAIKQGQEDTPELEARLQASFRQGGASPVDGSVGWGDAVTILPWTLYQAYGDCQIIENQYESAKKWVDFLCAQAENKSGFYAEKPWYQINADGSCDGRYLLDTGFHWGEWLEPDGAIPDGGTQDFGEMVRQHMTEVEVWTTTAYFAHSAELTAKMAGLLGKTEDEAYYQALADKEKELYIKYFVSDDGTIRRGRQAPQARTLAFDLVPAGMRQKVADRLNDFVTDNDFHLNTGFLSTPFLLPVLARNGYVDTAYKLLLQKDFPSWLFSLEHGATTICEHWLCYTPGMDPFASANHYSYGSVCSFLFTETAGIQPLEPGYKKILIEPLPGNEFSYAKASFQSPYGLIRSEWTRSKDSISYEFEVPANTTAVIRLQTKDGIYETAVGSGICYYSNIRTI